MWQRERREAIKKILNIAPTKLRHELRVDHGSEKLIVINYIRLPGCVEYVYHAPFVHATMYMNGCERSVE